MTVIKRRDALNAYWTEQAKLGASTAQCAAVCRANVNSHASDSSRDDVSPLVQLEMLLLC